ncbi:conserved hypothetical protein [Desulfonatronospira thiodismutans ASO3-1]|uniref:Type IV secretion system coupling protein TraD DNA-binding domain-containing protein n=1 Tax=Desulfonatronospira thiodismutans ASO3-1 TaxID=555779 RepID=D6SUU1_9BACT|nr:type IV secretory system conjugative DNA transfer family protein [Desulfonatronospira thiodismutans]EFI33071.1 conserved hypothetical protein [Desulfonatronospira thiodismutans ASO3-1]
MSQKKHDCRMGFVAHNNGQGQSKKKGAGNKAVANHVVSFDSGDSVSMDEAVHNQIVFGNTGCGKTSSVILPSLSNLMAKKMGGLVFDIKNNFTHHVRKLAHIHGRLKDVVEIGSFDSASPVNILAGLGDKEMEETLDSMIVTQFSESRNAEWIHKGARITKQCARVLRDLDRAMPGKGFAPSLALLSMMLNDEELSGHIWELWKEKVQDTGNRNAKLSQEVESDRFNILISKSIKNDKKDKDMEQQIAWRLAVPRKFLDGFSEGSLADNLSADRGDPLDLEELIFKQKKIVVLRFSPRYGSPGTRLARLVKEMFYNTVYSRFGEQDKKDTQEKVFNIMDEFQDIINLDENSSMDDFSWISKSREFGVINIAATQTMSSLYRSKVEYRVRAMLANFSTKIIMQTDDPATQEWVSRCFATNPLLSDLGPAETAVLRFKLPERRYEMYVDCLQKAHDSCKEMLDKAPAPPAAKASKKKGFNADKLYSRVTKHVMAY